MIITNKHISSRASDRAVKRAQLRSAKQTQQTLNGNRYFFRDSSSDEIAKAMAAGTDGTAAVAKALGIGGGNHAEVWNASRKKRADHKTGAEPEKKVSCAPSSMTDSSPSSVPSSVPEKLPDHLRYLRLAWLFLKGAITFLTQCLVRGFSCLFNCTSGCLSCFLYNISRTLKFIWLLTKASLKFLVRWMLCGLQWLDKRIILDLDL